MTSPSADKIGKCQCQLTCPGHTPGDCQNLATDPKNLCAQCSAMADVFHPPPLPLPPRSYVMAAEPGFFSVTGGTVAFHTTAKPLPEHHSFYALVGRVASEWAHLEHILDGTIWGLLGGDKALAACVTSQILGVAPRCKAIITLCSALGLDQFFRDYRSLMSDSYDTADWRNRYVHDYWNVEAEPGKASQFRAMSYKDMRFGLVDVDKTEIDKTIGKIKAFQERASKLRGAVLAAIAASREKLA